MIINIQVDIPNIQAVDLFYRIEEDKIIKIMRTYIFCFLIGDISRS